MKNNTEDNKEYCYGCNREITESNYRMFQPCPYAEAMSSDGDYNPSIHMCSECYGNRVGDI